MDKRKLKFFNLKKRGKKLFEGFCFFAKTVFLAALCFFMPYFITVLAKNGSDVFYYAMAFASPGSAIEFLSTEHEISSGETEEFVFTEEISEESAEESVFFEAEHPKNLPEVPKERQGKISEMQISSSEGGIYISHKNAVIKNCTSFGNEKIKSVLNEDHGVFLSTESETAPQILIYHTHATEGFEADDRGYFDLEGSWRSTDPEENMIAVGDVLTSVLTEKGIGVIHDGTLHDHPGYTGSYSRSAATVSKHIEENPSLKIFLDLHRDAMEPSESEIIKPTAVINGKKAAQIMIISGCGDGSKNMEHYWKNLGFAAALANKIEELYPGLCRPVLFDYRKYNMDLSTGLLLIEIGSTGNTLEEAKYSAELLGNALIALFSE